MKCCVYCGCDDFVKNGIVFNKQRYKCKGCGKNFREGVVNTFDIKTKKMVIKSYLNGMGFRAIARVFDIPITTVYYFIKKLGKKLEELKKKEINDKDIIQILEADELFTYVGKKNKPSKSMDSSK